MRLGPLISQINREVSLLTEGALPASTGFRVQAAISVLARVPILLSSAVYSDDVASGLPPVGLDNALAAGSGICGNHVELGLALFDGLGIPARDVQIYYDTTDGPLNHTVVEVYWDEAWRMIDLTYGFIPHRGLLQSALSFAEARTEPQRSGLHHELIPWRLATKAQYDIFNYLDAKADAILYSGEGIIPIEINEGPTRLPHPPLLYTIGPKPHYRVGPQRTSQNVITLQVPAGRWEAKISGNAMDATALRVAHSVHQIAQGSFTITQALEGPSEIELAVTGNDMVDVAPVQIGHVIGRRR